MPKVIPQHREAINQFSWNEFYNELTVEQQVDFWKTISGSPVRNYRSGHSRT